jgi:SAM-dependent methyltransferase
MKSGYSILRELQYAELEKLTLDGEVLDLGGSTASGYHELIKGSHRITAVNINPEHGRDLDFDIEKKFPLKSATYDHVLCVNTLEHVYDFGNVAKESHRVLRQGGTMIVLVPFFVQLHGSPDDYFRYTHSALRRIFQDAGFSSVKIAPLGYGACALLFQAMGGAVPTFLRSRTKRICVGIDRALLSVSPRYRNFAARIPLGYSVSAQK